MPGRCIAPCPHLDGLCCLAHVCLCGANSMDLTDSTIHYFILLLEIEALRQQHCTGPDSGGPAISTTILMLSWKPAHVHCSRQTYPYPHCIPVAWDGFVAVFGLILVGPLTAGPVFHALPWASYFPVNQANQCKHQPRLQQPWLAQIRSCCPLPPSSSLLERTGCPLGA